MQAFGKQVLFYIRVIALNMPVIGFSYKHDLWFYSILNGFIVVPHIET